MLSTLNYVALAVDVDPLAAIDNDEEMARFEVERPAGLFSFEPNKIKCVDYIFACSKRGMECLAECKAGSANYCAVLAFNLKQSDLTSRHAEKLYALGYAQA